MRLPELAVRRPVAIAMAFMAVLVFGIVAFTQLPLDILPELELPSVTVITVYPGASAEEVEHDVTAVIETVLSGTENLLEIRSQSKENVSFITLVFDWDSDITTSASSARDLLDMVGKRLPSSAQRPMLFKLNSNMMPVLMYGMSAHESYDNLEHIINTQVADPIRRVPGVGTLMHIGVPRQEFHVAVNPERLRGYNVSVSQISALLQAQTMAIPGGSVEVGVNEFAVRIPSKLLDLQQLRDAQIATLGGSLRLGDVADVRIRNERQSATSRGVGGPGIALIIQKQTGANTLEVVSRIRERMTEIRKDLPPDIQIEEILYSDEVVRESVSGLGSTLLYSLFFVMLVVLAMLRDWRQSFIVVLTIPFSLITALIMMFVIGWSINIYSLMSLIIAMGMVVDNAIVVLENINQHIERGADRKEAAMFGASEMGSAIVASTMTSLMVFLPMVFMGGVVGVLFKQLAVLISVMLVSSLLTALALTPMVSSRMLLSAEARRLRHRSVLYEWSERLFQRLETAYSAVLHWAVRHKAVVLVGALLLFGGSILMAGFVGTDYVPELDAGDVSVSIQLEVSASVQKTDSVTKEVMKIFQEEVPEIVPGTMTAISGQTEDGALTIVGFKEGQNVGTVMCHLTLPSERDRTAKEIAKIVGDRVAQIPEIQTYSVMGGSLMMAAVQGIKSPIEFELYGHDLAVLNRLSQELADSLQARGVFSEVMTTRDPGKIEIVVDIDERKAAAVMLNSGLVGMQVREAMYGAEAGKIVQEGKSRRIYIQYADPDRDQIEDIRNIVLTNVMGEHITLGSIADVRLGEGVLMIERKSQQRIVMVKAGLDGISLGEGSLIARDILRNTVIPDGVEVELGGQIAEQGTAFSSLILMLVLGILMVYMVMAGQFESFLDPFIIMMAVPLTFIGVVLAFFVTHTTLSVSTFIGIIMLMGIVVNNGIVLVDYTNLLRKRGYALHEAVREAGRSRLRPVLMTSLTTMLGMLPMALSSDMGREIYSPLGITMIGGMFVSTLITLIVVPTFYAVMHRRDRVRSGLILMNRQEKEEDRL